MEIYNTILESIDTQLAGGSLANIITPTKHHKVIKRIVSYIDNKILNIGSKSLTTSTSGYDVIPVVFTPRLPTLYASSTDERVNILGSLYANGNVSSEYCQTTYFYQNITTNGFNLILRSLPGAPAVSFIFEYTVVSVDEFPYTLPV